MLDFLKDAKPMKVCTKCLCDETKKALDNLAVYDTFIIFPQIEIAHNQAWGNRKFHG